MGTYRAAGFTDQEKPEKPKICTENSAMEVSGPEFIRGGLLKEHKSIFLRAFFLTFYLLSNTQLPNECYQKLKGHVAFVSKGKNAL